MNREFHILRNSLAMLGQQYSVYAAGYITFWCYSHHGDMTWLDHPFLDLVKMYISQSWTRAHPVSNLHYSKWTTPLWFDGNDTHFIRRWWNLHRRAELSIFYRNICCYVWKKKLVIRRCQGLSEFVMELTPQTAAHTQTVPTCGLHSRSQLLSMRGCTSPSLCGSCRTFQVKHVTSVKLASHSVHKAVRKCWISAVVPGVARGSYNTF